MACESGLRDAFVGMRGHRACRVDLQMCGRARPPRVPGHSMCRASTTAQARGASSSDDRQCRRGCRGGASQGCRAWPVRITFFTQHAQTACFVTSIARETRNVMGMPRRRWRGVLQAYALSCIGCRRRGRAHRVRGKAVPTKHPRASQRLEPCARARRRGSTRGGVPTHPLRWRRGAGRASARCQRLHLRSPDGTRSLRLMTSVVADHETFARRRGARDGREHACVAANPIGGAARNSAASSSSHARNAMNPEHLRERSG